MAGRAGTFQVKGATYDFETEKMKNVCFLITVSIKNAYQMPDTLSGASCRK